METPPNLQVCDLGHLDLAVSVLGRIRLAETVDYLPGPAWAGPGASSSCARSVFIALGSEYKPPGPDGYSRSIPVRYPIKATASPTRFLCPRQAFR